MNPNYNQNTSKGDSGSKKKKNFKKKLCPYCMRGFHPEDSCMKKQVDQLTSLLKQNNIALSQRAKKPDDGPQTKDDERFCALKDSLI